MRLIILITLLSIGTVCYVGICIDEWATELKAAQPSAEERFVKLEADISGKIK